MKDNAGLVGVAMALVSAALYGITPLFVYHAFDYGADPFGLMTTRYVIASIILFGVRLARIGFGKWPPLKLRIRLFLLGAIGLYINSVCMFSAMKYLDSGLAMVIYFFYPILVVIFGWVIYRHQPPAIIWPCLLLTIIGVVLSASEVQGGQATGVALIVVGAFAYAIYSVFGGAIMPGADLLTGLWLVFTGAAFSFVVVWLLDPPGLPTTMPYVADVWLPALEIGTVGTIAAMGIFFAGMNRIGASKSAVIGTFEVLVSVGTGVLFLSQSLTPRQVFGAVLILGAVLLLAQREARSASTPTPQVHA